MSNQTPNNLKWYSLLVKSNRERKLEHPRCKRWCSLLCSHLEIGPVDALHREDRPLQPDTGFYSF